MRKGREKRPKFICDSMGNEFEPTYTLFADNQWIDRNSIHVNAGCFIMRN